MFIDGIGIGDYRSFDQELQNIGPLKKLNLIVGQNNSGKSNVLRFLKMHYPLLLKTCIEEISDIGLTEFDSHNGNPSNIKFSIGIKINGEIYKKRIDNLRRHAPIEELSTFTDLITSDGVLWFSYEYRNGRSKYENNYIQNIQQSFASNLAGLNSILSDLGIDIETDYDEVDLDYINSSIIKILNRLTPIGLLDFPTVKLVPAIREIREAESSAEDLSGKGLIVRLFQLQNPIITSLDDEEHFNNINEFLRAVIGNKTARIRIPHDLEMILVEMDGSTRSLESFGTGIHELIVIAAASTIDQNKIICIEEPEIHLHPTLQKKLIRYLAEKTSNQYFISTHSAHFLDMPDTSVFHIRYQDGHSVVEYIQTDENKSIICGDLGYRASDLLQANCIVWVEGPSDRIYINHWIKHLCKDLKEGLHYSIMFYGGRLLSHLSVNDSDIDSFISLLNINRHTVIVIDSDIQNPNDDINETKQRVSDEFNNNTVSGFAWVTQGREIENYISPDLVEKALKNVHSNFKEMVNKGHYDKVLQYKNNSGDLIKRADKVKIAHYLETQTPDLDILDLQARVEELVHFIRSSNDLHESEENCSEGRRLQVWEESMRDDDISPTFGSTSTE